MSAEIIMFVPRPNTNRPSLLEGEEIKAVEFLFRAPALMADEKFKFQEPPLPETPNGAI